MCMLFFFSYRIFKNAGYCRAMLFFFFCWKFSCPYVWCFVSCARFDWLVGVGNYSRDGYVVYCSFRIDYDFCNGD